MKNIWEKYFFCEVLKFFLLFICSFYFLYVLIDYSIHSKAFQNIHISFTEIVLYYLYQFTKRAEILIPVALLASTIKVLTTANLKNEIVALATGGISLKKILHPFLFVALLCAALLYLNFQLLLPSSLNQISYFEDHYFKGHSQGGEKKPVNALLLEDNTLLIYQSYDPEKRAFFDVFWFKNCDQLCRMKWLYPYEKNPLGKYVDSLMRTPEGEIMKLTSVEETTFPKMKFTSETLFNAIHPPRMQSFSQLVRHLKWKQYFSLSKMNDREAEAATFFYFKITMPLVCLLAVIGPAPFCVRFSRHLPVFLIYALSLCGILAFFTFLNASLVLGENQVLPPVCAILLPQILFFLVVGWKYAKL